MGLFLVWKSKNKMAGLLLVAVVGVVLFAFMPESWHERMGTITTYEQDGSAMGRLKAWEMAFNLAMQRPLGGGFETFKPAVYLMYLPEVGLRSTDAHSIYFETMAEHGFVGLGLFLGIGLFSLRACGRIVRATETVQSLVWMNQLARMIQVSLVGYAVSGAFLGLAYFDYYYALVAIVVGMTVVLEKESKVLGLGDVNPPATRTAERPAFSAPQPAPAVPRAGTVMPEIARRTEAAKPGQSSKNLPSLKEAIDFARDWYRRL